METVIVIGSIVVKPYETTVVPDFSGMIDSITSSSANIVDHKGNTLLIWSVRWKNSSLAKKMTEAGSDPTHKNKKGENEVSLGLSDLPEKP